MIATDESIKRLVTDHSGRFLFKVFEDKIILNRNLAIKRSDCNVELDSTDGELQVGFIQKIDIILKNTGAIPIGNLKARLKYKNQVVDTCDVNDEILPGKPITLSFSVKAKDRGDALPFELSIEMEDEAGPPISRKKIRLNVASK